MLRHRKPTFKRIRQVLAHDEDKYKCFLYQNVNLRRDAPKSELHIAVQFKHIFSGDLLSLLVKPLKIFRWMLKEPPAMNCSFVAQERRWSYQEIVSAQTTEAVAVEAEVVSKLDKEENTQKLAQILDMMPTLNIKLNQHQKSVVASNNNLLCLGRSGTGKTTTSVLRLFAQEILYAILKKHKERAEQRKKEKAREEAKKLSQIQRTDEEEEEPKKERVSLQAEDLEKDTGVKMVFITASPVLTTEVKRFYASVKQKLILHLRKKAEKQFQEVSEAEVKELAEEAAQEGERPIEDHEMRELLEFIRKEERDIEEDMQVENQLNIPNSFDEL